MMPLRFALLIVLALAAAGCAGTPPVPPLPLKNAGTPPPPARFPAVAEKSWWI